MVNVVLVTGELLNLTFLTGRKEKRKEVGNKNSCRKKKPQTHNFLKVLILADLRKGKRYTGERKQDTKIILGNIFFSIFFIFNHPSLLVH